jgi:Flp pilus assembly protein TadD
MKKMVWVMTLVLLVPTGLGAEELFDLHAAEAHVQKGLQHYFQKQYVDAIREFQETLNINPDDVRSYYFLGYSYYQLREMEKAQQAFDQAYRLNPQYTPIPNLKTVNQNE